MNELFKANAAKILACYSNSDDIFEKGKGFLIGQKDKSGKNVKTADGWKPVKTHGHLVKETSEENKIKQPEEEGKSSLTRENMLYTMENTKREKVFSFKEPNAYNSKNGKFTFEHISKHDNGNVYVYGYTMPNGGGRATMGFELEEFFNKVKIKPLNPESNNKDYSDVEPDKKSIQSVQKYGKMHHEFYQGGFISSSKLVFDRKNEDKIIKLAKESVDKETLIKTAKSLKAVFGGHYGSPAETIVRIIRGTSHVKARLNISDEELKSIENYSVDSSFKHNYKW